MNTKRLLNKFITFIVHLSSTKRSIIGILLGFLFGYIVSTLNPSADVSKLLSYPGRIFINLLKNGVVIFIIFAMLRTPLEVSSLREAKSIGLVNVLYSIITSLIASFQGMLISNVTLRFASKLFSCDDQEALQEIYSDIQTFSLLDSILKIGLDALPSNVFKSIVQNNILGMLVTFLVLGFILASYKDTEGGRVAKKILDVIYQVIVDFVTGVIYLTPLGVFSLITGEMSRFTSYCVFKQVSIYIGVFLLSSLIMSLLIYPLIYFIFTRKNPYKFHLAFIKPIMTAFATASSVAALTLNMDAAREWGIKEAIINFSMPMSATLNMDGSSIYYPITIYAMSRIAGRNMNYGQQLIVCIVGPIVTLGGAPIPAGAIVYLKVVSKAANIEIPDYLFSYIWAIDPLMDRVLTSVNVTGDAYAAKIIEIIVGYIENRKKKTTLNSDITDKNKKAQKAEMANRKLSNSIMSRASQLRDQSIRASKNKSRRKTEV